MRVQESSIQKITDNGFDSVPSCKERIWNLREGGPVDPKIDESVGHFFMRPLSCVSRHW